MIAILKVLVFLFLGFQKDKAFGLSAVNKEKDPKTSICVRIFTNIGKIIAQKTGSAVIHQKLFLTRFFVCVSLLTPIVPSKVILAKSMYAITASFGSIKITIIETSIP